MNKMKEELLKTVGNVTKNKQHVIVQVERQLEEPKKRSFHFVPFIVAAFVIICIALVTPQLLNSEVERAAFHPKGEKYIELDALRLEAFLRNQEEATQQAESDYVEYVALQAYAYDQAITITEEDIANVKGEDAEILSLRHDKMSEMAIEHFEENGYSKQDYDDLMENYVNPKLALRKKLRVPIEQTYTKFDENTHAFLLSRATYENLEQQHVELYNEIQLNYEAVYNPLYGGSRTEGIVLQVTEQAILLLFPEYPYLFGDHELPVRWAAKLPEWDVHAGDTVVVHTRGSYNIVRDDNNGVYQNVDSVSSLELLTDRSVRIEVEKDVLASLMDSLYWQPRSNEPSNTANYTLTDNLQTYKGYLTADKGHVIWYHNDMQTTVPITKAIDILFHAN